MSDTLFYEAQGLQQAGELAGAARLYHELLQANPRHFDALYALAMLYFQDNKFEPAQHLLGEAIRLDPLFLDGLCIRGVALVQLKRYREALACFDQAIALRPDFVEALLNRAATLTEMNRPEEALAGFDQLLALDPGNAMGWNNRANALVALKRFDEALPCYDRALELRPDFPEAQANRLYARTEANRGRPEAAELLYEQGLELMRQKRWNDAVQRFNEALAIRPDFDDAIINRDTAHHEANRLMFDGMSENFDQRMLQRLGYQGHRHLRTLAERIVPGIAAPMRLLDLGCGTGLVGETFSDWAQGGRLDGIDLSPRMIEAARARGVYDDLILGDLEKTLAEPGHAYDLVLAADTLVYFGDLSSVLSGIARRLEPGGAFLFAVERMKDEDPESEGWKLTPSFRFSHKEAYLRKAAEAAGFDFVDVMECALRYEIGEPVAGLAVALRKPSL